MKSLGGRGRPERPAGGDRRGRRRVRNRETIAEALTGHAFSLADLAYYTGNAALVAYYCVTAFAVVCIALLVAADRVRGRWTAPAWADSAIVLVPLVAALAAIAYAVLTFTWDPDDARAGWALFVRFVGIAAVAAAVVAHRRSRARPGRAVAVGVLVTLASAAGPGG